MEGHVERASGITRRQLLRGGAALACPVPALWTTAPADAATVLLWMSGGPSYDDTFGYVPSRRFSITRDEQDPPTGWFKRLPRLAEFREQLVIYSRVVSPECCHARARFLWLTGRRLPLSAVPPARVGWSLDSLRRQYPRAFTLSGEPPAVIRRYGETAFGRQCLIARRLLESGASWVVVELPGWDTHMDAEPRTRRLCEVLDPAFAALLNDLYRLRLNERVRVIWAGDFGRTSYLNAHQGRDHDPNRGCVVIAGAGVGVGRLIEKPVAVEALLTMVYSAHRAGGGSQQACAGLDHAHQS